MNIYEPTAQDIRTWAFCDEKKWPASDWDFYVLRNPDHDELVVELANDADCPKQRFFLHALYYVVGETFHNRPAVPPERIDRVRRLLDLVGAEAQPEVQQWKDNVQRLMAGQLQLDPEMWLHFMFQDSSN